MHFIFPNLCYTTAKVSFIFNSLRSNFRNASPGFDIIVQLLKSQNSDAALGAVKALTNFSKDGTVNIRSQKFLINFLNSMQNECIMRSLN